ncbi:MAG: hypothetical protein OXE50_08080, partial [Chloroflexi bacterium]|nr:hypothetical protein [Chloroflexota bacterium]
RWPWRRSATCRMNLALACYNAGCGPIFQAQIDSGMALCWDGIQGHVPYRETREYVGKVNRRLSALRGEPWASF